MPVTFQLGLGNLLIEGGHLVTICRVGIHLLKMVKVVSTLCQGMKVFQN
uniref:Uncharacterized protein LOC105115405 n=1 Tax=Rhizophora mucronata TaxID=61149 RepID=A0A2P2JVC7_RHIMU